MKRLLAILACGLPMAAFAQPAPIEIGNWRLSCTQDKMTDASACVLRLKDWVEAPSGGQPGLALEIVDRGGRLVPAITARDLTLDGIARGVLALTGTAQLRFPPNMLYEMPCGLEGRSLVCAPQPADAERAEKELLAADRALARMVGPTGSGGGDPAELKLAGTKDAIARFVKEAPPGNAPPPKPLGIDPVDLLQKMMKGLGN